MEFTFHVASFIAGSIPHQPHLSVAARPVTLSNQPSEECHAFVADGPGHLDRTLEAPT